MKGSTLQELLRLNQQIMIQQQLKISALLAVIEETVQYGKKKNDLQLGAIIEKGMKKLSAFDEPTKFVTEQLKSIKSRIEQENKEEQL